jgi:hypothetical protein
MPLIDTIVFKKEVPKDVPMIPILDKNNLSPIGLPSSSDTIKLPVIPD